MKRNHIKAVVWPRHDAQKGVFRYAIVGMLVTETEIASLRGKPSKADWVEKDGDYVEGQTEWPASEFILDGEAFGLEDLIDLIKKRAPNTSVGDANSALCSLNIL